MKHLSISVLVLTCLTSLPLAQGQQRVSRERFDAKVQELLAKRPKIKAIYSRSEVAKHVIERQAEQELAMEFGMASEPAAEFAAPVEIANAKNLTNYASSLESETSVAISKKNKDLIVACANDDRMFNVGMPAYVSTNGGLNWRTRRLPHPADGMTMSGGDPVIVPDPDGGFYYAFLSYDQDFLYSDIQIAHSSNGTTWELRTPVVQRDGPADILEDKEWIAVDYDQQSPFYGRLYVAWRRFDMENFFYPLTISWSDDKGYSWSAPIEMESEYARFAHIKCGKGGVVLLSASHDFEGGHALMISRDGGYSFETEEFASFASYPYSMETGHMLLKSDGGFRAFPYTTFDVDPLTEDIYMVSGTSDGEVAELVYQHSTNFGKTWKELTFKKAGKFHGDRFMPTVTFDQHTRTAWATFYSSEEDEGNQMTKIYRVELTSKGIARLDTLQPEGFDPFECISATRERPFLGDYIDSDAHEGRHVAVWGQSPPNGSDADVYAAVTNLGTSDVKVVPVRESSFTLSEVLEQPLDNILRIQYNGAPTTVTLEVYDMKSAKLQVVNTSVAGETLLTLPINELPAGFYHLIVTVNDESILRKFVKRSR